MPSNVVYDGNELRFVTNRDNTDSGTRFFVDSYNEMPTLDTGTVHAERIVAKRFVSTYPNDAQSTQTPVSGALDIVNALRVVVQSDSASHRYSIDRQSLETCEPLRPHVSRMIIKQREVTCFVFTQLLPIMISAMQELGAQVDALAKHDAVDDAHHHHDTTVHPVAHVDASGCPTPHVPNSDVVISNLLAQFGMAVAPDSSGVFGVHGGNDGPCGHCGHVLIDSYLLSNMVKLVHEQDAYIAYLTQRLSGTSAATANTGNLVVGSFYVHRKRSQIT